MCCCYFMLPCLICVGGHFQELATASIFQTIELVFGVYDVQACKRFDMYDIQTCNIFTLRVKESRHPEDVRSTFVDPS